MLVKLLSVHTSKLNSVAAIYMYLTYTVNQEIIICNKFLQKSIKIKHIKNGTLQNLKTKFTQLFRTR